MSKETKFIVELAKLLAKHDVGLGIMDSDILTFDITDVSCSNTIHDTYTSGVYDISSKEVLNSLIGKTATADHPITCANPDIEFIIHDVKLERGIVFVRGENTMWFGESMINIK